MTREEFNAEIQKERFEFERQVAAMTSINLESLGTEKPFRNWLEEKTSFEKIITAKKTAFELSQAAIAPKINP